MSATNTVAKGLAGVAVDQTAIADVRGDVGTLAYRGVPIGELVNEPLHGVANLLIRDELSDDLAPVLAAHAPLTPRETDAVLALPRDIHPMLMLQGLIPVLDPPAQTLGFGEADQGLVVAAKMPGLVSTHLIGEPRDMDDDDYGRRFLCAIGTELSEANLAAFNATQILQMEHSFNAGTFAARVIASTLAPIQSAIAGAVGALYGPLHGGADQAVLEIADTLRSPADGRAYVDQALCRGEKIPGMGHREYRVRDPRAALLQEWVERLGGRGDHAQTYAILRAIETRFRERMAEQGKDLYANVEFYKGLVLRVLGLPNHYFTALFAMARVFGYIAHFIESRQDNRIFRPAAIYVGR